MRIIGEGVDMPWENNGEINPSTDEESRKQTLHIKRRKRHLEGNCTAAKVARGGSWLGEENPVGGTVELKIESL